MRPGHSRNHTVRPRYMLGLGKEACFHVAGQRQALHRMVCMAAVRFQVDSGNWTHWEFHQQLRRCVVVCAQRTCGSLAVLRLVRFIYGRAQGCAQEMRWWTCTAALAQWR